MPLHQLADEIVRLNEQHRSTPVLVTPRYLSLRKSFFVDLVVTLFEKTGRSIRIDWCRGMPSPFSLVGDRIASVRAARMNRALASLTSIGATARFQINGLVARPSGVGGDLVIGICDQQLTLPGWATPIRLGASPLQPQPSTLSHQGLIAR